MPHFCASEQKEGRRERKERAQVCLVYNGVSAFCNNDDDDDEIPNPPLLHSLQYTEGKALATKMMCSGEGAELVQDPLDPEWVSLTTSGMIVLPPTQSSVVATMNSSAAWPCCSAKPVGVGIVPQVLLRECVFKNYFLTRKPFNKN